MMRTPTTPSTMAAILPAVMRSPRKLAARIAVQIGMVNSIDTTWPSGISIRASQPAIHSAALGLEGVRSIGGIARHAAQAPARGGWGQAGIGDLVWICNVQMCQGSAAARRNFGVGAPGRSVLRDRTMTILSVIPGRVEDANPESPTNLHTSLRSANSSKGWR